MTDCNGRRNEFRCQVSQPVGLHQVGRKLSRWFARVTVQRYYSIRYLRQAFTAQALAYTRTHFADCAFCCRLLLLQSGICLAMTLSLLYTTRQRCTSLAVLKSTVNTFLFRQTFRPSQFSRPTPLKIGWIVWRRSTFFVVIPRITWQRQAYIYSVTLHAI